MSYVGARGTRNHKTNSRHSGFYWPRRADAWQEQPCFLEYHHEGAEHRYTPDILVVWGAHQEVVEIKEDSDAELPENQARFALIRELLAAHGYHFRPWKRSEICAEPRLTNASLILRYRCVELPAAEHERIRRTFSPTPELRCARSAKLQGWRFKACCASCSKARYKSTGGSHLAWTPG